MQKLGVFRKIQDICYQMGTEIFKIEEETTEKMKPKVSNPPYTLKNRLNIGVFYNELKNFWDTL